jgi:CMP-N-acetylneuraminic acid synthetase
MKPICFIGARGGSKGVPRKNIRILAGKPLIAYTIEAARKSKIFSSIVVSTEDKKVANIAKKYGADIPFVRPKKLATDTASMNDVLLHGIQKLQSLGYTFDTIVVRDCTVPFIRINDIKGSISLLKNNKCDIVCGVYKQHHNPYFNMMEPNSKGFLHFSKKPKSSIVGRQQAPTVYQLTGLFAINVKQFLKYKKFYMPKNLAFEIPYETGLMIDTNFEFQLAECIAKMKLK